MFSVFFIKASALILSSLSFLLRGQNAYLDPGSGSYLLQLLLAGLLGGLFVVRSSWDKIKDFFRRVFSRGESNPTDDE